MLLWTLWLACSAPSGETGAVSTEDPPRTVPWSGELPALSEAVGSVRGRAARRAIVHLHSPWSHDACDGEPLPHGEPDAACLADLRAALCRTRVDVTFLTDHPTHAAWQPYEALTHPQPGDDVLADGLVLPCAGGDHQVLWLPGIEDELMPVALARHSGDSPEDNDRLYNGSDAESLHAHRDAGAVVLMAHTEGRDPSHLQALQEQGLVGVEVFNLHAMFAPDIRAEDLGLDGFGWANEIGPFTRPDATAEPDLLFLGVLQHQTPSLARWDELLARGPMVGVAGTDAHQNVLPIPLRDGERGDSYRRMMRWFSNVLLTDGPTSSDAREALEAGRAYVAFEALGTPAGFDVHLLTGDQAHEMGAEVRLTDDATLEVSCPTLFEGSPQGEEPPEIRVVTLKDGEPWQEGCGSFSVALPGAYRVQVEIVPHHLRPFLGDEPEPWLRPFPWIYGNAIRVVP